MNSRYALIVLGFGAVAFAALSGCGSPDMTKDQAKSLLNDYFDKNPTTHPFATGMASEGTDPDKEWFASPGGKYQKAVEADGLITIVSKGKVFNPEDHKQFIYALDIALTDKGKTFVTGKSNTVQNPPPQWPTTYENAIFCSKEVVDVADVSTTDDTASVEYTYRAAKLTPFAIDFQKTDPTEKVTCNTSLVEKASATIVRKDNVWAVTVAQ